MEIKPCPFCGNRPALSISNSRDNYVYVMCQNDDCLANIGHNSADDAIRAWNKRYPLEDIDAHIRNPKPPDMRMKRYPIKKMLKDGNMKRKMIVGVIMFCQGHEGRHADNSSATQAYQKVCSEKLNSNHKEVKEDGLC